MLPAGRILRARRFAPVHLAPLGSTVALADQISREFNDDAHEATGAKLTLQLKSGDSSTRKRRGDAAEIFTLKKPRHAEYWIAQAFPVLLVIRNSEGEVRGMEVRAWLPIRGVRYSRRVHGAFARQVEFVPLCAGTMALRVA